MKRVNKIISVVVAAGMMLAAAPSMLWAKSATPTGEATDYFPGDTALFYDPQAAGTKFEGTLTVTYEKAPPPPEGCTSFIITKMTVVLTLQQGKLGKDPERAHVSTTTNSQGICFDNTVAQVNVILQLIHDDMIPFFYNCTPSTPSTPGTCPGFKVKSFTNFQYTTGANSADIKIAVQ